MTTMTPEDILADALGLMATPGVRSVRDIARHQMARLSAEGLAIVTTPPPTPSTNAARLTGPDFRAWRRRLGWSQTRAAEALGTTRQAVARWEAIGMPQERETLVALACEALERRAS